MLQAALSAGLASEGADVVDVGVLPTPALAWLSATRDVPAVVISASHNPFADNGIKLFAAGGLKLSAEVEAAIEDELERVLDPVGQGPPHARGPQRRQPEDRARHRRVLRRPPRLAGRRTPAGRPAAGGRQRQRGGLGAGRTGLRTAGCRGGGHRLRARRHQHQRRVRVHLDRDAGGRGGRARRPPGSGPRRGRRPAAGRGRRGQRGQRGRAAGPVRPRPGRARPAGRQHRGGHGDDQPRVPAGHGGAGHHREGDAGRGPPRAGRPGQGRLRPRGRAVGPHRLPAAGHHRRRAADRAGPGRPGGPHGAGPWPSCWTGW